LKGDKKINIGDLIKTTTKFGRNRLATVVDVGYRDTDALLSEWVRIRYVENEGYEWIKKGGIELIS